MSTILEPTSTRRVSKLENPHVTAKAELLRRYLGIRGFSKTICETLEPEDYVIQTMPEASPTKWHLAHTSWFFEVFVLKQFFPDYQSLHPQYGFLFNSYYNAVGEFYSRAQRGLLSRPTVKEVLHYCSDIDLFVSDLVESADEELLARLEPIITLGLHHEQQHQELMLTDIKNVFWQNPLRPAFRTRNWREPHPVPALKWLEFGEGIHEVGHKGSGFSYDNEGPCHRVFLETFQLASRLITNAEFLMFMEDGGYRRPELWLSLGWNTAKEKGWEAPLYWERRDGKWHAMTLAGMASVAPEEPVCHVSLFEANAFARWSGARLAAEEEWEVAATGLPLNGNFVENELFHVQALASPVRAGEPAQMFGDVWEWTRSSYSPYPGYSAVDGALGEYNGKFMCNQYILRGGSCATSESHIRPTYRNFFPPETRWQFSGIRLAKDVI